MSSFLSCTLYSQADFVFLPFSNALFLCALLHKMISVTIITICGILSLQTCHLIITIILWSGQYYFLYSTDKESKIRFQVIFFFLKRSFRFIAKLRGKYGGFPYIPCLHTCVTSPIINIPHQISTFVTAGEHPLTHHNHQKPIISISLLVLYIPWVQTNV